MGTHRFDNAAGGDNRLAGSPVGRTTVGSAFWQRGDARDESVVFIAPFHHDTVSKRLSH